MIEDVSLKENSALAMQLMEEASARYRIEPGQLTLHQDRGSPMTANGYLGTMRALDITCSHSRPRVSNDNPVSESAFKTLKYQPDYPGKFNSIVHARQWCDEYYQWVNNEHHHSGLNGYTPMQVFTGNYARVLSVAYTFWISDSFLIPNALFAAGQSSRCRRQRSPLIRSVLKILLTVSSIK